MGAGPSRSLRAKLALKEKELELVLAIDHVRDTVQEPSAMLGTIASALAGQFQADLCLLCLLNRETGEIELKAINELGAHAPSLEHVATREMAEQVCRADGVTTWRAGDALPGPDHPQAAMHVAGMPILMQTAERLGAVLLARTGPPFGPDDLQLLGIAESQLDSAVLQGYTYHELQQRNKELETIYRVDRIRDQQLPFDEMLNTVIQELRAVIEAEAGFIMLYNHARHRLELRASTRDELLRVSPHGEVIDRVANEALRRAGIVCRNDLGGTLSSALCVPLILKNEVIGVLGLVNRSGAQGFRSADCCLLNAIASQMDTAIFEGLERRRLRQVLGRSVDPHVMARLLANPDVEFLKGERSIVSVLYSDIRGSTRLAEQTDPELLVRFVNESLSRMAETVLAYRGTLDKFVGDGVMALFGAPFPQADHALQAVCVGLDMQAAHRELRQTWTEHSLEPPPIGVGIATGELIAGELGCAQRTDYTVIGRAANLGARLCGVAKGDQVLISQGTYDLVREQVETVPITGLEIKGIGQNITAYEIVRVLG